MTRKLPYKTFLKTFELVPRAAVSLLIKNKKGEVLLTKRKNPPFANYWHLPGSFILKTEPIKDCIKRIVKEELGTALKEDKIKLLGVFENLSKDPRGHVIDIIYSFESEEMPTLKPIGNTKDLKFFKKLPSNIGFHHKETLMRLGYR